MNSMTGFGFSSIENKNFKLEVSIKSVNSRFLDIKFYTPAYYFTLEPELQKKISQKCKRGCFVVHINRFPSKPIPFISVQWNKDQAKKWKTLYQELSKKLNIKNDLGLKELVNREGVLNLIEKPQPLSLKEKTIVKKAFDKSLQDCLQQRKREGIHLKKDLISQLESIQAFINQIEILNKKQKSERVTRTKKLEQKKDNFMETEKFDVHEEVVRVKEHLSQLKKIISKSFDVGRKIDFYTQEILREINTIGAKAILSKLTLKVVETKFCLEKIKEQTQNVE